MLPDAVMKLMKLRAPVAAATSFALASIVALTGLEGCSDGTPNAVVPPEASASNPDAGLEDTANPDSGDDACSAHAKRTCDLLESCTAKRNWLYGTKAACLKAV